MFVAFTCHGPHPPSIGHHNQETTPDSWLLLWKERKERNVQLTFWPYSGLSKELVSVLPDSECWREQQHTLDVWGLLRTKASMVACYSTKESAVPRTDTRESKRLWVLDNRGKPSNWKITHTSPKEKHPHKRHKGGPPQNLYPGWWVKVFPCTKPVCRGWERWLSFQMPKSQQKITK